jgi:hypothetical protein
MPPGDNLVYRLDAGDPQGPFLVHGSFFFSVTGGGLPPTDYIKYIAKKKHTKYLNLHE